MIRGRGFWGHAVTHGWIKLLPVSVVFVHHDVAGPMPANPTKEQKIARAQRLDQIAHDRDFLGISYNYIQFEDGDMLTGRGMHVGAHNDGRNDDSIGIVLPGNFEVEPFSDEYAEVVGKGIAKLKYLGRIKRGYTYILMHGDTDPTACPGRHVRAKRKKIRRAFKAERRRVNYAVKRR